MDYPIQCTFQVCRAPRSKPIMVDLLTTSLQTVILFVIEERHGTGIKVVVSANDLDLPLA